MSRKGLWYSSKILLLQFASITRGHEGAQSWLLLILTPTVSPALSALKCIRTNPFMSVTQKALGLQVISHSLSTGSQGSIHEFTALVLCFLSILPPWEFLLISLELSYSCEEYFSIFCVAFIGVLQQESYSVCQSPRNWNFYSHYF